MLRKLPVGMRMNMRHLPDVAEAGYKVDPVNSDELLKRTKFRFPIYAFGYNWLDSNRDAGEALKKRVRKIIAENNTGRIKCTQVILVTHSMGGLVARACSQLPDMGKMILGIVHGVMPATGAAVAYRRCKVGMRDESYVAGLVIGSDGKEVTAVFSQAPGALQLLPSESYGTDWLEVRSNTGQKMVSLPKTDPYEEIYMQRNKWWGLVSESWLSPRDGIPISWGDFIKNIKKARDFHRSIDGKYHRNTYVFYGGGVEKRSYSKISWNIAKGSVLAAGVAPPVAEVLNFDYADIRTKGFNAMYVGGETTFRTTMRGDSSTTIESESSHWEITCSGCDSAGDGTVPSNSGKSPRMNGGMAIRQQFEVSGIEHEPVYKKSVTARQITHYAITKLASIADIS